MNENEMHTCIWFSTLVLPLHLFLLASGQYHAHELASLSLCWDPGHVQVWDGPLPENVQVTCDLAESRGYNIRP